MKQKELTKKLLNQFIYSDNDDKPSFDYCNNCNRIIIQKEFNGVFYCEHCDSENISIHEVD